MDHYARNCDVLISEKLAALLEDPIDVTWEEAIHHTQRVVIHSSRRPLVVSAASASSDKYTTARAAKRASRCSKRILSLASTPLSLRANAATFPPRSRSSSSSVGSTSFLAAPFAGAFAFASTGTSSWAGERRFVLRVRTNRKRGGSICPA
eukprot:8035707-Pyramimonas_sp.AAC.1